MKKILIAICIMSSIFWACSKGGNNPSTDQPTYIGKWNLTSYVIWNRIGPMFPFRKDTIKGRVGEYLEFRTDSHEYQAYWQSGTLVYDTTTYQIINNLLYDDRFPTATKVAVSGSKLEMSDVDTTSNSNESFWWFYSK